MVRAKKAHINFITLNRKARRDIPELCMYLGEFDK